MSNKFLYYSLLAIVLSFCSPYSKSGIDIDVSRRAGKAPLSVVAYIFFNRNYKCADISWSYWYKGFSSDKNEMKEKTCGKRVATHEFGFINPGQVNILIIVKLKNQTISKKFTIRVEESNPGELGFNR